MGFSLSGAISGGVGGYLIGGPVGGGVGALVGGGLGGLSDSAREDAAEAALEGQRLGIEEQRRQFDLTREDYAPFLAGGVEGQAKLLDLLNGRVDLENDPLLKLNLDLAKKQAGRFASASGSLGTGAYNKDLIRGNSDVFNNRINQYLALSGRGQNAAGSIANAGSNAANNISNSYRSIGETNAALDIGKANSIDNLINTGLTYGLYKGLNKG